MAGARHPVGSIALTVLLWLVGYLVIGGPR